MTTAVSDNTAAHRFEIVVDGEPAGFLDYLRDTGRIVLLHTEIYDDFRGRGLGNVLIAGVLDRLREERLAIEPHCSFVAAYLEKERPTRAPDVSLTGIPHIGRATVIGAIVGAVIVGAAVAAILLLAGVGPVAVVAGAHVGLFGGMGYGGMVGAVAQAERHEKHAPRAVVGEAQAAPRRSQPRAA